MRHEHSSRCHPARRSAGPGTGEDINLLFLVSDGFPTFRADVAALFGKYLPRFGVNADLITHATRPDWRNDVKTWLAGRVRASNWREGRVASTLSALIHSTALLLSARRGHYSAIQVRDRIIAAVLGLLKARANGIPFFYWMSFPHHEMKVRLANELGLALGITRYIHLQVRGHFGTWLLYRLILPASDHVFVQSGKMLDDLASRGIAREKMTAVPMCIDPERFEGANTRGTDYRELKGRRVIAYLGTCGKVRRIDFLVDVAAALRDAFPNILLLLVGEADEPLEMEMLRRYISDKGLNDYVVITGWLDAPEAQRYMMHAEVALALMPPDPLLDSATPTKLVEYLALGKPVVANEHPDQTVVMRESGAGLCVPFERGAFAEAITTIMNDPPMAARFSEAGRTYVFCRRNYRSLAESLANVYKRLLGCGVDAFEPAKRA